MAQRAFVNPSYADRTPHAVCTNHIANLKRFGYIAHEVLILNPDGSRKDDYMVVTKSDGTTNTVRISSERVPNNCTCEHFTREVESDSPHASKLWACKHILLVAMVWHPTNADDYRPTVIEIARVFADKKIARDLYEANRSQPVVNGRGRDPWLSDADLDAVEGHLAAPHRRPLAVVCEEM